MANKTIRKVTKVDSQIPKMKGVDYRINKMNDVEQIRKVSKDRKREEDTLNELARDVIEMAEDVEFGPVGTSIMADEPTYNRMTNQPSPPQLVASRGDSARNVGDSLTNVTGSTKPYADMDADKDLLSDDEFELEQDFGDAIPPAGSNHMGTVRDDKYIYDYRGDGLDYGATHSESFTGTAAIALAPAAFGTDTRKSKKKITKKTKLENAMSRRRLVREYSPDFAAGNYKPGDGKMQKKGGKGVQAPSLGKIDHNAESELTSHGEQWPRKKSRNVAMSDVDDNGVDGQPQGSHKSSVGKPDDGYQTSVGHDWPAKPKNRGGTKAMKGSRYQDGGTLGGVSAESWSPANIGNLMGKTLSVQSLFDRYARSTGKVTQEGFVSLCEAYGEPIQLDRDSMLNLMERNRDFVFYEDEDSDGSYWVPSDDEDDMNMVDGPDGNFEDEDGDGIDDDVDGELTDEEHSELHMKLKAFCKQYGCPENELHELCHEYAQTPMGDMDDEDFDDEECCDDDMDDMDDMDESMGESWGEGMECESWGEGEGADEECMGEGEGVETESDWEDQERRHEDAEFGPMRDLPPMKPQFGADEEFDDYDNHDDHIGPGDDGYNDGFEGDDWRADAEHYYKSTRF